MRSYRVLVLAVLLASPAPVYARELVGIPSGFYYTHGPAIQADFAGYDGGEDGPAELSPGTGGALSAGEVSMNAGIAAGNAPGPGISGPTASQVAGGAAIVGGALTLGGQATGNQGMKNAGSIAGAIAGTIAGIEAVFGGGGPSGKSGGNGGSNGGGGNGGSNGGAGGGGHGDPEGSSR